MCGPVCVCAADAIAVVEGGGDGAGVSRLEGVDCCGLEVEGEIGGWVAHRVRDHPGDLGGGDIVDNSECCYGAWNVGKEALLVMIDRIEGFTMSMAVFYSTASYWWELTGAIEPSRSKRD